MECPLDGWDWVQEDEPGASTDIRVRDGGGLHRRNGSEAGAMGAGETGPSEVDSTGRDQV